MLLITNEDIKRAYAAYNLLDPEQQKAACEIAQKFPCTTEYVAKVLIKKGFNREEAEEYIMRQFVLGKLRI